MKNTANPAKKWLRFLLLFGQGALIGIGAILPGVSGGMLCMAFGIYEPMMALLTHPFKAFRTYYKMFIPVVLGGILGFFLLASAVNYLLEVAESITLMLFAGLIFGTMPDLIKKSEKAGPKQSWTPFVLALSLAFVFFLTLSNGEPLQIQPNSWWFLFCGLVWGLSIVIPGLSSSSILVYMGLYEPMTEGISISHMNWSVVLPLFAGLLITVVITARPANWMLEKKYALMTRLVAGIMAASTLIIIPRSFDSPVSLVLSLLCFAGGFALARWMDIARAKQEEDSQPPASKTQE